MPQCNINGLHTCRKRPRGLPEVGQMPPLPTTAADWNSKARDSHTPFRLPRLDGGVDYLPGTESISSYHHSEYMPPSPELFPQRSG